MNYVQLDENNYVKATSTAGGIGYELAPDGVDCGWKKLDDGTWQEPQDETPNQ